MIIKRDTVTLLLLSMQEMTVTINEYQKLAANGIDLTEQYLAVTAHRVLAETIQEFNAVAKTIAGLSTAEDLIKHEMVENLQTWISNSAHSTQLAIIAQLPNFEELGLDLNDSILRGCPATPLNYSVHNDSNLEHYIGVFHVFSSLYDAINHQKTVQ